MFRIIALFGAILISFSAIFVRLASVSPSTAAVGRTLYALPPLVIIWLAVRKRDDRKTRARAIGFVAGMFLGIDLWFWHHAIDFIGAGLATVLGNTQVIFVGAMAWLLHRERPSRVAFLTIPIVFAGVVMITGMGRPEAYGIDPIRGSLYGILTGMSYATFLLVFRHSNRRLAHPAGPLLDATLGAFSVSLLIALWEQNPDFHFTWPAHGWLIALALVSQVVGWLLISSALPRLPALDTSVVLLLQPMMTVMWGRLIFGEALSRLQWLGVLMVLGGVGSLSLLGATRSSE